MGELVIPGSELKEMDTTDMKNDTIDRISYLPEPIMHHILSFLPTKDAARTSVLSKTWQHVWATFPISDFDGTLFGMDRVKWAKSEKFINFVDGSLLRLLEQKTSIQRFRLLMALYDYKFPYRIDHWIDLARANNVKELYLHFLPGHGLSEIRYRLPQTIYAAKSLNVLSLEHCVLEQPLCNDTIKFEALKELSLSGVYADEHTIQNLVDSCPSIEKFVLKSCEGVKSLQLHGFTKLKKVKVKHGLVERIHIEASNLQTLNFVGNFIPCKIDMMACKNLTVLKLKCAIIDDQWFQPLIPLLKTLVLFYCLTATLECPLPKPKPFTISSYHLERLELSLQSWVEYTIEAPNLCLFKYEGDINPSLSSMDTSSVLIAELKLYPSYLGAYRYSKLREYLGKFSQIKVLNLHIVSCRITFNPEEFEKICIPPVCDIEHMKLKINATRFTRQSFVPVPIPIDYEALVDGLLWASHPRTLSVESGWSPNIEFLEVLCKKLMYRCIIQSCCRSTHFRCWHNDLKGVKIKRFAGTRASETLHYRALLELLPTLPPDQMITFEFKW